MSGIETADMRDASTHNHPIPSQRRPSYTSFTFGPPRAQHNANRIRRAILHDLNRACFVGPETEINHTGEIIEVFYYPVMPLLILLFLLFLFTQDGDQNRRSVIFLHLTLS
jgi:hypothetical protein